MPFSDLLDTVEITLGENRPPEAEPRPEPTLIGTPLLIEFDEPARLDPERIGLTWELPPPPTAAMRLRSSLGALAVHLLPIVLILFWPATATEVPVIPVQLVLEQPPPEPPQTEPQQAQQPPDQPKPGRLASEDMGDTTPKTPGTAAPQAPPAAGEKQPEPSETKTAAAAPAPPPLPPPKPAPPKPQSPAVHPSPPSGAPVAQREETPREAPRPARVAGPASSQDDYLAYLVTLTRQHIDLLPMSVVGSRHGETIVTVDVKDDGTILHVSVAKSSGYPDIDDRIERMVAAVQKFPPVPAWFKGSTLELQLMLRFPEALARN